MKRYLTTPIYYANGAPHLGHVYTTLVADCYRHYYRLADDDVMLITGTDEHGQKIERTALARGIPIDAFVRERSDEFRRTWRALGIGFDRFERTTGDAHKMVARAFWQKLAERGDIYKGRYDGLYCVECEQYFASGDECPVHRRPLELFSEPTWFFRLSAYRERLIEYIRSHAEFIRPAPRRNEVLSLLENDVLNDLSISRTSTRWGVPVPGDDEHVMYVWIDALVSYLSALGDLDSVAVNEYWPGAIHFIGKDILVFHGIYWPAFLMSAGLPLPESIIVNGWLTVEGRKISKSDPRTIVDPVTVAQTVGNDGLRLYFLKTVTFGRDLDFDRTHLVRSLNADLANNLGNLVSRFIALVEKHFPGGFECSAASLAPGDRGLLNKLRESATTIENAMAGVGVAQAARCFIDSAAAINAYIQEKEPWRIDDPERLRTVLWVVHQALSDLTVLGWCFVPRIMKTVREGLGLTGTPRWSDIGVFRRNVRVSRIPAVFPRIEGEVDLKPAGH